MAGVALKMALILAVALSSISAFGAPPTGVSGINFDDFKSTQVHFIFNELEQAVKTPAVHPSVLNPAFSNPTTFPDIFQVFEDQRRSCWNCIHDLSGQNVITVRAKPIDLPAQIFQLSPSRLGAFALQDATVIKPLPLNLTPSFFSHEFVDFSISGRHHSRATDSQINPNNLTIRDERVSLTIQNNMQEQPVLFVPNKIRRTNFPFTVTTEICREFEPDFLASIYGRQCPPSLFELDQRSTFPVITNSLPLGLGTTECFRFDFWIFGNFDITFSLKTFDGLESFSSFGKDRTDELRRQFCYGSFSIVIQKVYFHPVGCMIIPAGFCGSVEGFGILANSVFKDLSRLLRTDKLEFKRHIHIQYIEYEYWLFLQEKLEFLGKEVVANSSAG